MKCPECKVELNDQDCDCHGEDYDCGNCQGTGFILDCYECPECGTVYFEGDIEECDQ